MLGFVVAVILVFSWFFELAYIHIGCYQSMQKNYNSCTFHVFLKKIKVKSHVKNLIGKEKSMKFQHEHETKPKLPLYFFLFSIFPPYFDL